jgi:hypothetical protein
MPHLPIWERANRLVSVENTVYTTYDGDRTSQRAGSVVTAYPNDTKPGLTKLLAERESGVTTARYLHGPRRILAQMTPQSSRLGYSR